MNVPYRVMQLTAGQIHLHIPSLTAQPEIIQPVFQLMMQMPGVTSIEIEPPGDHLLIKHAATPGVRDRILSVLSGKWGVGSGESVAPQAETPTPANLTRSTALPYADCQVIHATQGRVRLRVPVLRSENDLAGVLSHYLAQQPGVSHVRLSPFSQSVIVHHDPAQVDAQALVRLVADYQPAPQEITQWRAAVLNQPQDETIQPGRRKVEVALAAAALLASFFGGWLAYLLAIALLIASSWWIFRRASRSIQQRQFLTLESASAAAIVVLCLAGMLWQASLFVMLLLTVVIIRSRSPSAAAPEPTANRSLS